MDQNSDPLSISLKVWPGYGYFVEIESYGMSIYSLYWVPEKDLRPVLMAVSGALKDKDPLSGCKVLITDAAIKPPKPEDGPGK
jgi:hypothetical protein